MAKTEKAAETKAINVDEVILKVKRELIQDAKTKSGEDMYSYVLREIFKVNGQDREFLVEFTTKGMDFGGYDMLNIIFMLSDEANLRVIDDVMVNTETGETIPFTTYEIYNTDEDGIVYAYKVKPNRESDKAKLNVVIQKKRLALEKAKPQAAVEPEKKA